MRVLPQKSQSKGKSFDKRQIDRGEEGGEGEMCSQFRQFQSDQRENRHRGRSFGFCIIFLRHVMTNLAKNYELMRLVLKCWKDMCAYKIEPRAGHLCGFFKSPFDLTNILVGRASFSK